MPVENQLQQHFVSSFYLFEPIDNVENLKKTLKTFAQEKKIQGLVILADEGINCTIAAPTPEHRQAFEGHVQKLFPKKSLTFKHSQSENTVFRNFKVKIRPEIVTLGVPKLHVGPEKPYHLSPKEWNDVLKDETDVILLDARNRYETQIGKFKGAIEPDIDQFSEFPEYLKKENIPTHKKILIYCTGGIRCEKGLLEMRQQGYKNVYQLDGGILNYLEQFPNDQYEGSCFVFDHRIALDQSLKPVEAIKLCPHTGNIASIAITCQRCDSKALIAEEVATDPLLSRTCSKNCAYHWNLNPHRKGTKQPHQHRG